MTSRISASGRVAVRGDGGVAGERRIAGVQKFHSWGKCTMPLTNINSDWIFNASSALCIILELIILRGSLIRILGCLVSRPLPDFISQLWRKLGFFHKSEIKSGSGLGTRLIHYDIRPYARRSSSEEEGGSWTLLAGHELGRLEKHQNRKRYLLQYAKVQYVQSKRALSSWFLQLFPKARDQNDRMSLGILS